MKTKLIKIYLADIGEVITGNTPPTSDRHLYNGKYPLIMPTDMVEGEKYIGTTAETISEEGFRKYKKNLLPKNTPCVVTIGSIGKKLCMTKEPSFTNQAVNAIRVDETKFDSTFIFYLLKYNLPQVKYLSNGTASGRENVSKSSFSKIKVILPENIYVQKKIANILSSYDQLIENNKKRIKLLEEMAEEIFKEWFVRLRFPGHEDTKIIDGLPEGWEKVKLSSFCTFPYGSMPIDKNENLSLEFPYEIQSGHGCKGYTSQNNIEEPTIIITVRGSVGRVEIMYEKCWVTNLAVITKYSSKCKSIHFLYHELKNKNLEWLNTGSAIPQITSGNLGFVKITLPEHKIQIEFENLISPFYKEIQVLNKKIELLKQTQELLLPRLISGKLSVEHLID